MKKISEEEFRDYLEYKNFMNEGLGGSAGKSARRKLSMDELDQVRAAKGTPEFEQFLRKLKEKEGMEDK